MNQPVNRYWLIGTGFITVRFTLNNSNPCIEKYWNDKIQKYKIFGNSKNKQSETEENEQSINQ